MGTAVGYSTGNSVKEESYEYNGFHFANEGFFGGHTYAGGADKLAHFVDYNLATVALANTYRRIGYASVQSGWIGFRHVGGGRTRDRNRGRDHPLRFLLGGLPGGRPRRGHGRGTFAERLERYDRLPVRNVFPGPGPVLLLPTTRTSEGITPARSTPPTSRSRGSRAGSGSTRGPRGSSSCRPPTEPTATDSSRRSSASVWSAWRSV